MGKMSVMGETGDTKISWDSDNPTEVEAARKTFEEYKKKGFAAFRLTSKGSKGSKTEEFDLYAGQIVLVPPIAGG